MEIQNNTDYSSAKANAAAVAKNAAVFGALGTGAAACKLGFYSNLGNLPKDKFCKKIDSCKLLQRIAKGLGYNPAVKQERPDYVQELFKNKSQSLKKNLPAAVAISLGVGALAGVLSIAKSNNKE